MPKPHVSDPPAEDTVHQTVPRRGVPDDPIPPSARPPGAPPAGAAARRDRPRRRDAGRLLGGARHVGRRRRHASAPRTAARTAYAAGNPLAGRPWGVYQGRGDQAWQPYAAATGTRKQLLARIALRPKAKWFGAWIPATQVADKVRAYVAASQAGNPDALVQLTLFAMKPWEHDACKRLPTAAEQASYADWTNRVAGAIGDAHAAVVLQPDGPFALCAPGGSTLPSSMIAASARRLSALPNTSVYIEAGAADWPAAGRQGGVDAAVRLLVQGGVRSTRGFALNGTHYSSTADEVARGAAIVRALAARGIPGKHFVVNTSSNGHPFTLRLLLRTGPGQRVGLHDPLRPAGPDLRDPGDPAHHGGRRPEVGPARGDPRPGGAVRRRLPLVRSPVALPAGRPVRDVPGPAAGALHAVLTRHAVTPGPAGRCSR